jgi:N4-gp56 family major capsid protein
MFNVIMINPQLFATEVQTTLLPALAPEVKTFYDKNLIEEASAALVHDQFGQKRPIPKNGGKTIEFRKFASLPKALTPLTEGVTPDGKNLNVTAITAEVAQYGDYVVMSDVLDLTAIDSVGVETSNLLGNQMGLTMDTVTRNELQSGTNVTYCPKVAADGTETEVTSRSALDDTCQLTVKVVQQVVAKLKGQNAPKIDGKYVAIIHPYVAYSLMRDPEWVHAHTYGGTTNLFTGEIGEIAGVRFVETTEAKVYEGGVFGTLFMGANAYGVIDINGAGAEFIYKPKGSAGTADPLDQRSSAGWKGMKAAKILVDNYIVRVESKVADFADTPAN